MTTSNRRRSKENAQVGDGDHAPMKCATTMWRPNYAALKQAALREAAIHQKEQQKPKTPKGTTKVQNN